MNNNSNTDIKNKIEEKKFLEEYNPNSYEKPSVTTDLVTLCVDTEDVEKEGYRGLPKKELNILLVKRDEHPHKGKWSLAGGFVALDETAEDTALRVLRNKTYLNEEDVEFEQLYTFTKLNRDERMRVITMGYLALLDEKAPLNTNNKLEASWFKLSYSDKGVDTTELEDTKIVKQLKELTLTNKDKNVELSFNIEVVTKTVLSTGRSKTEINAVNSEGLAFDHAEIIATAMERLRGKLYYSGISFNLVKPLFTLKELQTVHELILDKTLEPSAFRKRVASMVEETDKREYSGTRKAKLFKRKINQ